MLASSKSIVSASIIIGCCLILGLALSHTAAGQSGTAALAGGRYQIVVTAPNSRGETIYVFEPNTGECWLRGTTGGPDNWVKLGSPAMSAKK
jgi:hypothetical protein